MQVKYSNEVKNMIESYRESLNSYPISNERKIQKIRLLKQCLNKTIKDICQTTGINSFPVCAYKDLGQSFDANNNPSNQYLRETTFSDESKTKWSISFMLIDENKTLLIYSLRQSNSIVQESLQRRIGNLIREYLHNRRSLNENKEHTIMMNEPELREMILSITKQLTY